MFQTNDLVRKRADAGQTALVISGPAARPGGMAWRVKLTGDGSFTWWLEQMIESVPSQCDVRSELTAKRLGTYADFSRLLTFHRLDSPLRNTLYSLRSTKTDFYPHQFKAILKLLANPAQRMLIADEVGLGKTIEAGIIYTELQARMPLTRVLIVCPSSLRVKWRMEMKRRFSADFAIFRGADELDEFLKAWQESAQTQPFHGIASMQLLRREDVIGRLKDCGFELDLVIVDEAHHMRNRDTLNHSLGADLSMLAESMIMLTATPVNLATTDLFNLLHILDPDTFQDLGVFDRFVDSNQHILQAEAALRAGHVNLAACESNLETLRGESLFSRNPMYGELLDRIAGHRQRDAKPSPAEIAEMTRDIADLNLLGRILTRTRKSQVVARAVRRDPHVLKVEFLPEEMELYNAITALVTAKYPQTQNSFERFILSMPQRMAASSLVAFITAGHGFDTGDDEGADESVVDAGKDAVSGGLVETLRTELRALLERRAPLRVDTKYDKLAGFLRNRASPQDKLICFSTFKNTLRYLEKRLTTDGFRVERVDGDVEVDDRARRVERFRDDPSVTILLSSEVSSEGLDFQFCATLVNYDLPWNPMVVEQRIGRLDRLGQKADVITIVNFSVTDTIEADILERLYLRIGIFERSIGMLEGILGDIVRDFTERMLTRKLSQEDRQRLAEEAAQAAADREVMQAEVQRHANYFMGLDDFLEQEVEEMKRQGRFIAPRELCRLFLAYLDKHFPHTRYVRQGPASHLTYSVEPDSAFRTAIRGFRPRPGQAQPYLFLAQDRLSVTFSPEQAEAHSDYEFVHVNHPVLEMVKDLYRRTIAEQPKAVTVRLARGAVPQGWYVFLVHRMVMDGARKDARLHCAVCPLDGPSALADDRAERLFHEMLLKGDCEDTLPEAGSAALGERYDLLRAHYDAWELETYERAHRRNQAQIETALASIRTHYENVISSLHERRLKIAARGNSSLVKAMDAQITKRTIDRDQRIQELEGRREIDYSSLELIGGLLYVTP